MFRSALPFAAVLALSLAACHSTPAPADDAAAGTPAQTATPIADASKRCDAAAAQWAIGQTASQQVVDKVVADSGSAKARVIKPGQAVTMDFREDRVNTEVDAANVITAVRCG